MPIIVYACECTHIIKKFVRQVNNIPASFLCEKCGKDMKKQLSSPSSVSKITVDNGVQARAVEVRPDIIELMEERSNKDYKGD